MSAQRVFQICDLRALILGLKTENEIKIKEEETNLKLHKFSMTDTLGAIICLNNDLEHAINTFGNDGPGCRYCRYDEIINVRPTIMFAMRYFNFVYEDEALQDGVYVYMT